MAYSEKVEKTFESLKRRAYGRGLGFLVTRAGIARALTSNKCVVTGEEIGNHVLALENFKEECYRDDNIVPCKHSYVWYDNGNKKFDLAKEVVKKGTTMAQEELNPSTEHNTPVSQQAVDDLKVAKKLLRLQEGAKKRGLNFDLSFAELKRIMKKKTCHFTGIPISAYLEATDAQKLTLDRKDPTKGYVSGNVVACSYMANQLKAGFEHQVANGLVTKRKMFNAISKMVEVI